MIDIIVNTPGALEHLAIAAAGLAMLPVGNWISKKVPDYTGEDD